MCVKERKILFFLIQCHYKISTNQNHLSSNCGLFDAYLQNCCIIIWISKSLKIVEKLLEKVREKRFLSLMTFLRIFFLESHF